MKLFVTALILFSCISSGYAQISDEEFDSEIDKLLKVRTEDLWQSTKRFSAFFKNETTHFIIGV